VRIDDLWDFGKGPFHGFPFFLRFSIQTSIIWLDNKGLDEFFTFLDGGIGEASSSSACRSWLIENPACMASRMSTDIDVLSSATESSSYSSLSSPII
jgi:hypothetical protein